MTPDRKEINLQILELLEVYFVENPDTRFCQGLRNIGVVDTVYASPNGEGFAEAVFSNEFYTESSVTLAKIFSRLSETPSQIGDKS